MRLISESGWMGVYTRDQAPGALANGSRVRKVAEEGPGETPLGQEGTVLGSMGPVTDELRATLPDSELVRASEFFYFVEWDRSPRVAVGVCSAKVAPA